MDSTTNLSGHVRPLLDMWGDEFSSLTPEHTALVIQDYAEASDDDRRDYRRNIGAGNLSEYAKCLAVTEARQRHAEYVKACHDENLEAHTFHMWQVHGEPVDALGSGVAK